MVNELKDWLLAENQKISAIATLQKDFDCFILCYAKKLNKTFKGEESFVSPLNELKLENMIGAQVAEGYIDYPTLAESRVIAD